MTLLTFVIPVRHQDNATDWDGLKRRLAQTVKSVAAQTDPDWRCIVVANAGADLPSLPEGFSVERVDFEPNPQYAITEAPREAVYEAVRFDKGRRVLTGMLAARDSRYFMVVDDDDFVSRDLVSHVARHDGAPGWKIERGYLWSDGSWLVEHDDFSGICGTSLIVRADLYNLPKQFENADVEWMKAMLGSHIKIAPVLEQRRTPLAVLPFRGAIYRVGHSGAHSRSRSILRSHIVNKDTVRNPLKLLQTYRRSRRADQSVREEFFGVRQNSDQRSPASSTSRWKEASA